MADAPDDIVGRTLGGRYRVVRAIGRGGMGAVYEALQIALGRRVAIKVLFDIDARSVERFRQEALAAANLVSPNIVAVNDLCEPPDAPPFLVMELLEGEPLSKLLAREGALAPERAARIAAQALAGLSVAHAAGVVHRDLKPANLFVTKTATGDELVKVLDFGVAKVAESGVQTTTGVVLGTPAYLAPEQILGGSVGPWTDVYAVGVCLHEMLSGRRLWTGPDVIVRIPTESPPPPQGAPPELAAVVMRALARDARERFQTADAMLAALAPFARDLVQPGSPAGAGPAPLATGAAQRADHGTTATQPRGALFAIGFLVPLVVALIAGAVLLGARWRGGAVLQVDAGPHAPSPPVADATVVVAPEDASTTPQVASDVDAGVDDASSAHAASAASSRARPATSASASAGATDEDCTCIERRSGPTRRPLCPQPLTPRCRCVLGGSTLLCPGVPMHEPLGGYTCVEGHETYGGAGKRSGETCKGYRHESAGGSSEVTGTLDCSVCYPQPGTRGTHGETCSGVDSTGSSSLGTLDCARRAPRR